MSTRCYIGKLEKDGRVKAIYCHHDGYPEGVGKTLKDFYDDKNADQLLALGDLSSLGVNPVSSPRLWDRAEESMRDALSGEYCIAYKDRGEEGVDAREYGSLKDYENAMDDGWIEYAYLLKDGAWLMSEGHGWKELK